MPANVCTSETTAEKQYRLLGNEDGGQRLALAKRLPCAVHEAAQEKPFVSPWSLSRSKRLFDIAVALPVLVVFAVPMLAVAVCIRLTSRGPAIFVQQRVGRHGQLFSIYKFRTMKCAQGQHKGLGLTREGDCRITTVGRWLRKLKLDELPQMFNVMQGELSLVGPRPKLPQYEAFPNMPYRPGITGASTLAFRNEEKILCRVPPEETEQFYNQRIKPLKARIDVRYMKQATLGSDIRIIAATILSCVAPGRTPAPARKASKAFAASQRLNYSDYGRETCEWPS